jgi:hypothetical protein
MASHFFKSGGAWLAVLAFAGLQAVQAGTSVDCTFDHLADGWIDGQPGWTVFDKVKDSSAFMVAADIGAAETAGDKALIVKASDRSLRCVTEEAVRWLRMETARAEFDFRIVVPRRDFDENRPVMVFLLGNAVLSEKARWEVGFEALTNGAWKLSAALPDEASAVIPAERLVFKDGASSRVSEWLHCVVEVRKLSETDSFESAVHLTDRQGEPVASLRCTDTNRDPATMAIWNLSRLHAGFLAPKELKGMACIDNFSLSTAP